MRSLILSISVDFDKSAFLQMVLFAGFIILLKPLLIDPMLALFTAREAGTVGVKDEARAMQEKAADILRRYENEVSSARAAAQKARDESRQETAQLEAKILAEGRRAAEMITTQGRDKMTRELDGLARELETLKPAVAQAIQSRILEAKGLSS